MYPSAPESFPPRTWIGIGLVILAVLLLVQNLNPVVSITFLGFVSTPLPLSLAILGSFGVGALGASLWNQLAGWVEASNALPESRPSPGGNSLGKGNEAEDDDDDVIEVEYLDR